jgi:DNA-binding HxlR family transcriptional regulator
VPLRSDWSGDRCPIARSLDVVGDPWVLLILRGAFQGTARFEDFRRTLGVADNVLSRRLVGMVDAGLLVRRPYRGEQRTHHEYRLTEAGADLLPVLNALTLWGEKHTRRPQPDAIMTIVHTSCGAQTNSADRCSGCGEPLVADDVTWHKAWRPESPDVALVGAAGDPGVSAPGRESPPG